jgi:GNAT superfamily N-acetyltransferase
VTPDHPLASLEVKGGARYEVSGRSGRASLLSALVRRNEYATVLGVDPDHLTVVGHLSWTDASQDGGAGVGEVKDVHVRDDLTERGVGLGLRQAALDLTGIETWTGLAIPDSTEADGASLHHVDLGSLAPGLKVNIASPAPDESAMISEIHVVPHQAGQAVIVALAADSLVWKGHLSWTIERPGGRLGGEQAGLTVGEVRRIDTREQFRGKGVATRMYRLAQRFAREKGWPAEIDHNPDRTIHGERWAIKVGGWRPPLTGGHPMPSPGDLFRLFGEGP